jgi:hypothetical protein
MASRRQRVHRRHAGRDRGALSGRERHTGRERGLRGRKQHRSSEGTRPLRTAPESRHRTRDGHPRRSREGHGRAARGRRGEHGSALAGRASPAHDPPLPLPRPAGGRGLHASALARPRGAQRGRDRRGSLCTRDLGRLARRLVPPRPGNCARRRRAPRRTLLSFLGGDGLVPSLPHRRMGRPPSAKSKARAPHRADAAARPLCAEQLLEGPVRAKALWTGRPPHVPDRARSTPCDPRRHARAARPAEARTALAASGRTAGARGRRRPRSTSLPARQQRQPAGCGLKREGATRQARLASRRPRAARARA